MNADDVIRLLDLKPHPEGGHFRETFRDSEEDGGRSRATAIYYLLKTGEISRWHRIDAVEICHWYAGDPLELKIHDGSSARSVCLDPPDRGQVPQAVVPKQCWQSARSLGAYSLVGCTLRPGSSFQDSSSRPIVGAWLTPRR
jgi:predicted cupin superfamily sugar epimerase